VATFYRSPDMSRQERVAAARRKAAHALRRLELRIWPDGVDVPDPLRTTFVSYVQSPPSPQNAADLFAGEWVSSFPIPGVEAGNIPLFYDWKIPLLDEIFGSIKGWNVLELGPLEGMHTYALQQMGAATITAIEGSGRAYLRCLITKEILDLRNAHFELGDFNETLAATSQTYDLVLASGVLYHQHDPCRMLADASRVAPRLLLWTHFYDEGMFESRDHLVPLFQTTVGTKFQGREFTLHVRQYAEALEWRKFCGGHNETSHWMELEDLETVLSMCGYKEELRHMELDHPHGPAILLILSQPDWSAPTS
jgi:hypothetical protein